LTCAQHGKISALQVLVVDDDPGVRQLVAMTLAAEGWVVRTAADGTAALDEAQRREFDAVVLDLQMPVMDGRSFYTALRHLPSDVPVLLLSAYGSRRAQRELGANDALDKPFDPMVLVQRLKKLTGAAAS
jgi:DNA-binding response OmpR family regulator